jgi:hypothetical protein
MNGFYYVNTRKDQILHYFHRGHEQAPTVALMELCNALPDHANWIKWYAAVVWHSEYLRRLAEFTAPYYMLPASVYRLNEADHAQIIQGVKMDDIHYLRMFPVWRDFRGNCGTSLSQAKALSAAARLRSFDRDLRECCLRQLEWTVGRNPFGQSLMYGEGHDYAPQYTACSGDMVGSLPVGIQSLREHDLPYWPVANCYNYKEVWVHPASRWLAIQRDLLALDRSGVNEPPCRFSLTSRTDQGHVIITMAAEGQGKARFVLRADNLATDQAEQETELIHGKLQKLEWSARIVDPKQPWVAVIMSHGRPAAGREIVGGYPPRQVDPLAP